MKLLFYVNQTFILSRMFLYKFYFIVYIIIYNVVFSHLMVHIGKTYNLWYKVIEQLEDICDYFKHYKKNVSDFIKI